MNSSTILSQIESTKNQIKEVERKKLQCETFKTNLDACVLKLGQAAEDLSIPEKEIGNCYAINQEAADNAKIASNKVSILDMIKIMQNTNIIVIEKIAYYNQSIQDLNLQLSSLQTQYNNALEMERQVLSSQQEVIVTE